jgi:membrane-associated phospholipid phosphatase
MSNAPMEVTQDQSLPSFWGSRLLLGVGLPLLGFTVLASHIWQQGKGFTWDIPCLEWVHTMAQPRLDSIAQTLTPLGVAWGVLPVLTVIGCVLLYQRNWRSLVYLVVTPLGSALINRTVKLVFHRARPQLWEVFSPDLTYAFPSGHAMSSMAFVMVLIVLAWKTRWRWLVAISGGLFVVGIGWTRLYLGMHYPSDVLAGWLLAIAWSVGVLLLLASFQQHRIHLQRDREDVVNHTRS